MKVQSIAPGMIFSFVDRVLANAPAPTDSKVPVHLYMIISAGSEANFQDIQCMKITGLRNKEATLELPIIVNDAVSYIMPYNIFSFRREEIDMRFFKGIVIGDPDICTLDNFLQLCRDIYTDTLFGEIHDTLKTAIKSYQDKFQAKFSKVPKYEEVKFVKTVISSAACTDEPAHDIRPLSAQEPAQLSADVKWLDTMPTQYRLWSDQDIMRGLLVLSKHAPINIVATSNRFKSIGTLDNLSRSFRRRISERATTPVYTSVINGHEYKFNFTTGAVLGGIVANDARECRNVTAQIKKAMRIKQ